MRHRATLWVTLAAGAIFAAGCEQTAVKQVRVQPPTPAPQQLPVYANEPLPFPARHLSFVSFEDTRPAIDILVEEVRTSYETGQAEYRAGNVEMAKADFERGVNLIVTSGFQVHSDPQLSQLFDQIGDATQTYEKDRRRAPKRKKGDSGIPAPIDEIDDSRCRRATRGWP